MIRYRLEFAKMYLDDAIDLLEKGRFNSSASRAYYASYQAMWAALGDPEDGKIWRHLAIIKHFVRGYWFSPDHPEDGPDLLEDKRLPLRRLYAYRIRSDYDAADISEQVLKPLLSIVKQVISVIERKGGE